MYVTYIINITRLNVLILTQSMIFSQTQGVLEPKPNHWPFEHLQFKSH